MNLVRKDEWTDASSGSSNFCQLFHFDSTAHLVEEVEKNVKDGTWRSGKDGENYMEGDGDWTWGSLENYENTKLHLDKCMMTERVTQRLDELRVQLLNKPEIKMMAERNNSLKRKRIYAESGSELDIDRVMCADPMHWQTITKSSRTNVVRLSINYAVSSGNGEETFSELCALGIVAADMLSRAGFSVEITALGSAYRITDGVHEGGISVMLKRAEEQIDLSRIACIGIPGFFRCFTFITYINMLKGNVSSGLGSPRETSQQFKDKIQINHMIETKWLGNRQTEFLDNIFKGLRR